MEGCEHWRLYLFACGKTPSGCCCGKWTLGDKSKEDYCTSEEIRRWWCDSISEMVMEVVSKGSDFRYVLKVEGMELENYESPDILWVHFESQGTNTLEFEYALLSLTFTK